MKKMILSAAVVMTVCMAQALTFTWSTGPNVVETALNVNLASGSLTYLVWDTAGDGFDGLTTSGLSKDDDVVISQAALTGNGLQAAKTVTFDDGQSYTTGGGGSAKLVAGASATMYFIAFDATTIGAAKNYADSLANTKSMTPASGSPVAGYAFADASIGPSDWQPIPEPTSLALLAIGAVAIGLRRKFRK